MLKMVTVTGADDSVKPSDLAAVAAEYPFVEFGILFRGAENRTKDYPVISGKSRFPSFDWLMGMLKISESQPHLDLSCHLCGQAARDFLEGVFLAAPQPINLHFRRAQINTHGIVHDFDVRRLRETVRRMTLNSQQVIFQYDGVNTGAMLSCVGRHVHDAYEKLDIASLYDLFHWGRCPAERWSHPLAKTAIPCGFAGGLSPENVASQIEKIQIVMGGADFWIDAETHLRSDDDSRFDLAKVRRFLEAAKPYVQR